MKNHQMYPHIRYSCSRNQNEDQSLDMGTMHGQIQCLKETNRAMYRHTGIAGQGKLYPSHYKIVSQSPP